MAERAGGVHAVVWRSGEMPADLVGALRRQGISWEEASGPYEAVSRVLAGRRATSRARVLLMVEPETLGAAAGVRAALERFDPGTACWAYSAAKSPRLAPLGPLPKPAEPEVVVKRPSRAGPSGAGLRLAGESAAGQRQGPRIPDKGRGEPEEEPSPRSLLTPEELAMLLADDPE